MAASTSSAADSSHNYCYDVFINHRGPDVKKTFASHLYRRLISYGLRVFLDYQELKEGEGLTCQIHGAIRNASVHVAIFSPNYAESNWCLDELLLMLESKAPIIPVFYHVKPADMRWTLGEGVYARSLRNLQKKRTYDAQPRYNSTTIESWRNALSCVADVSGLDLEAFNGFWPENCHPSYSVNDEGELLDKVVELVVRKSKKTQLNVARYPTGLNEKVKDFETKVSLQQQSGRVQLVGITGLGGVGKTTLAKDLFNRKSPNYSKSYFLFDIRENAKSSLLSLQRKLLKGLIQSDLHIDSIDEGIEMLKKHFSLMSSQVLLVLDDVDHVEEIDALLPVPVRDVLLPNSLILVTARDKNVLLRSGVQESAIYKLTGLNTEHSKELFCSHAFCQPHPLSGFEYMVDKFLRACDGLPLSLKVFGALLYGNTDKSYWQDELDRLEQILPFEIQRRLQISFDALERDEQNIFLDIACFFIGENRDTALRIWDGSGWKGSRGFQSLLNKCLAEVDIGNNIRMHDHLRDLGRNLAKSLLPCRLWGRAKNMDDMLQHSPVIKVRGIKTLRGEYEDNNDEYASLSSYTFRDLQLLDIDDDDLEPVLRRVQSPNLLWLCWDNFPYSSLPSWIPIKDLRVLEMNGLELKSLWLDELKAPLQLRELEIYAPLTNIPESIGQLKHLERIVVTCGDFLKLQGEFCHRPSLRQLPESLGDLTSLEYIDLSYCGNLERLPNSFGNLIKLKHLNLKYCHNLRLSSGSLGNISTLEYINLYRCDKIEVLPSQIAHQRFLEKLNLNLRNLKEWPSSIGVSSALEKLVLKTPLLETLPPSLGSDFRTLRCLELWSCHSLKRVPDSVRKLNQLIKFTVKDCSLQELPFKTVEDESKTLSTELKRKRKQSNLDSSIGDCMLRLHQFQLFNTQILDEVSFAEGVCPTLKYLEIQDCNDLVLVGTLPKGLIKLVLIGCSKLRRIKGLCGLAKLQILNISWCEELEELPSFETLISLEELQVSECVNLKTIQGLEQLTKLRKLDVSSCTEMEDLPSVECLRSLEELWACSYVKLKSIQGLAQLTQLRELHVFGCSKLEELPDFEHLSSLEELWACSCVMLKRIKGLGQLTKLRIINVTECLELEVLDGVEYLTSLEELYASECPRLQWAEGAVEQLSQRLEEGMFGI